MTVLSTNSRSLSSWFTSHTSLLNVVTLAVLAAACLLYIVQVNHAVAKGYQIRDLEVQIQELTLSNQKLEVTTQQAQALTNVARATKMLGLVKADQPEYVSMSDASYALAQ